MAVRHRFVYRWPNNVEPITFDKWISTLSDHEKIEFFKAKRRQLLFRKQVIEKGNMTLEKDSYVWCDEKCALENKPTDEIWHRYFKRYLEETQTEFSIEEELC